VIVDEGSNRLCRAMPVEEVLAQLERSFQDRRQRAARVFKELRQESGDDRVYQLRTYEQVMERCRRMLLRCQEIILLDSFPAPLEELRSDIEAAASRGADVALKVYRPTKIGGTEVFVDPQGERVLKRWPGQWINLVVDGAEHLLAFLTPDGKGVHQAIWSGSAYLSWVYSGALASELILVGLQKRIEVGDSLKELQRVLKRYLRLKSPQAPGYQTLLRRFGEARHVRPSPLK
jgi:hypothetical protein